MNIRHFPKASLGTGSFDGGLITEIKPIGFPGEKTAISRMGPLFYWSWADARNGGLIGLHPHRGFEIISYVLEGQLRHRDTLGTVSLVGAGGAQSMQTASGVSHSEEMVGRPTSFFQIWFEPDMRRTLNDQPSYQEIQPDDFKVVEPAPGVRVKEIIGGSSPIRLVTPARMWEVTLSPNAAWSRTPESGAGWAMMVYQGEGRLEAGNGTKPTHWKAEEFVEILDADQELKVSAGENGAVVHIVEVPQKVDWPLYRK